MKDLICASVGIDHIYECTTKFIGREGENAVTQLQITLAEELSGCAVFLDFKKPKGNKYRTEQLPVTDNVVNYDVPKFLLNERGEIKVQLVLVDENDRVWKSTKKTYQIINSVNADKEIPLPTDFKVEVRQQLEDLSNTTQKHTAEIDILQSKVSINSKRLANLEAGIPEEDFVEDNGVAYVKDVPTNAMPYAEIVKIGGMTYKDGDTLKSAPVYEVERVGANKFDISKAYDGGNVTLNNGVFTQITADTSANLTFKCLTYNGDTLISNATTIFESIGRVSLAFEKTEGVNRIVFGLNGSSIDSVATAVIDHIPNGQYTLSVNFTNITQGYISWTDVMINKGTTALPYRPYTKNTLAFPEAVRPKNGINENVYDFIEWCEDGSIKEHQRVGVVDLGTLSWISAGSGIAYAKPLQLIKGMDFIVSHIPNGVSIITIDMGLNAVVAYYDTNVYNLETLKTALTGVMFYYELAEPIITDISDILPSDNLISVEGGGTLTFKNEHEFAVPSSVVYQVESEVNV